LKKKKLKEGVWPKKWKRKRPVGMRRYMIWLQYADYWSHEQKKVGDSRVLVVMKLHIIFHPSCQSHAHDTLFVVVVTIL